MKRPIYLDYAATTPVDPRVAAVMVECLSLEGDFGNPASNTHVYGYQAKSRIDLAREQVAQILGVEDSREIIFTSGATESNNLAIKGVMEFSQDPNNPRTHMITMATEHKAVLDPIKYLVSKNKTADFLKPESNGILNLEKLEQALKNNPTALVSIMWVNNETGVIQDICKIAELVKSYGAYFHVDAAQAVGKLSIDLSKTPIDLLSLSAHKFYGPKGIGALYVKRKPKVPLVSLFHGGGHEMGVRSGTLATHQLAGMGLAAALAYQDLDQECERILKFKNKFWTGISSKLNQIKINGGLDQDNFIPGILNICFSGVDSESLIMAMDDLAVSAGSACTSATMEASHVLSAMGLSDREAHESIRISLGRFNTEREIDLAIDSVIKHVDKLRAMSPA